MASANELLEGIRSEFLDEEVVLPDDENESEEALETPEEELEAEADEPGEEEPGEPEVEDEFAWIREGLEKGGSGDESEPEEDITAGAAYLEAAALREAKGDPSRALKRMAAQLEAAKEAEAIARKDAEATAAAVGEMVPEYSTESPAYQNRAKIVEAKVRRALEQTLGEPPTDEQFEEFGRPRVINEMNEWLGEHGQFRGKHQERYEELRKKYEAERLKRDQEAADGVLARLEKFQKEVIGDDGMLSMYAYALLSDTESAASDEERLKQAVRIRDEHLGKYLGDPQARVSREVRKAIREFVMKRDPEFVNVIRQGNKTAKAKEKAGGGAVPVSALGKKTEPDRESNGPEYLRDFGDIQKKMDGILAQYK